MRLSPPTPRRSRRARRPETRRLPRWPCPPDQAPHCQGQEQEGRGCGLQELLSPWGSLPWSPFGQNSAAGSWLWAPLGSLPPPSWPARSSGPGQAPDPAVPSASPSPSAPPPRSPPPAVASAAVALLPSPPPSQSQSTTPGLVPEAASASRPSSPPPPPTPDVCTQGVTGQSRVTAAWAWGSEPLRTRGLGDAAPLPPSPTRPPFLLPPPACRAESSAAHRRLGVFVREAISEGVLWLGRPRERPAQVPRR